MSTGKAGIIRVLVIEDVASEALLALNQLKRAGIAYEHRIVDTEAGLRTALRDFQPSVILSDFTLPRFDGLSALGIVRELAPDVPFIFVSGTIGEERAIEALLCGAVDYVLKTNLSRLAPAILRALNEVAAREERRQQEAQIKRLDRVLRVLSSVNALVVRVRDRVELLEETCRLAVRIGGYAAAVVSMKVPGAFVVQPVAANGVDSDVTENLRAFVAQSQPGRRASWRG